MTDAPNRRGSFSAVAGSVGRDTALFAGGSGVGLFIGLVTAIVMTHYLTPGEYGRLAIMLVLASLLTTLYNLGLLQGTLLAVFGATGEDEPSEHSSDGQTRDPRGALTAGLVATVAVSALGTVLIVAAAEPIASVLTVSDGERREVGLAAASGALGSVWRLAVNVLRLERRAVAFVSMQLLRPVGVLAISIPLVAADASAEAALAGLLAGTGIGLVATLLVSVGSYAPRLPLRTLPAIAARGVPYIPISLSFWTVHTADTYVVSGFSNDARTGEYRLATRLGAVVSYFTSAFLMTWSPMTRTAAFVAAERADRPAIRRLLAGYFVMTTAWIVLAIALAADVLVKVAPPEYAGAAPIVPLVALGWAAYALFVVVYRIADFERKRRVFSALAVAAAVTFLAAACILTALIGPQGAALANVVAFGGVTAILVAIIRRGGKTVPLDGRPVAAATGVGLACYALGRILGPLAGPAEPAVAVTAVLLFPVLLVALGIVPFRHLRAIAAAITETLWPRAARRRLLASLRELAPEHRSLLAAAAQGQTALEGHARDHGLSRSEVALQLVLALRVVGDLGMVTPDDIQVGHYLLAGGAVAERDVLARALWNEGVDPSEVHALETTWSHMREALRTGWRVDRA
jgi:O-antigen/teichoic acid export membrane protein